MTNSNVHVFVVIVLVGINLCCCNAFQSKGGRRGRWCVANTGASLVELQKFIDYGCSEFECTPIKPGGACFEPNTILGHASWILDRFYRKGGYCRERLGFITTTNPEYESCRYP